MKKVIFEKSILSCVLIFLICCIARVVEYFGIRTDETILAENFIHKVFDIITNIVYNYKGKVYYITDSGKEIELLYKSYDKSRDSQRYGFHPKYDDKRIFRIPLKTDPRIFTKVARNSKKWKRLYKKRTSIERVNGRIDRDFQFEKHTIRGLKKMKMFLTVTFIIQLTLAKAKIESGITNGLARYTA